MGGNLLSQNKMNSVLIEKKIDYLLHVPCSILNSYFCLTETHTSPSIISLTREEEGVGIASGLSISGKKVVLSMQNSGFGNTINAFSSLAIPYKIGFIVIISLRGDKLEHNDTQLTMGSATEQIIHSIKLPYIKVSQEVDFMEAMDYATSQVKQKNLPCIILLPRRS